MGCWDKPVFTLTLADRERDLIKQSVRINCIIYDIGREALANMNCLTEFILNSLQPLEMPPNQVVSHLIQGEHETESVNGVTAMVTPTSLIGVLRFATSTRLSTNVPDKKRVSISRNCKIRSD